MSRLLAMHNRETDDLAAHIGDDDRIKVSANGVTIDLEDLLRCLPAKYFDGFEVVDLAERDGLRLHCLKGELWTP